jgi:hypothetical protein
MAPKTIIVIEHKGGGLEQYYNRASELIEAKLHNAPTALHGVHVTEQDKADQAYHNALAEAAIKAEKDGHW